MPRRRLTPAQSLAALAVAALVLILPQCGSDEETDPVSARSDTPTMEIATQTSPPSTTAAVSMPTTPVPAADVAVDVDAPPAPEPRWTPATTGEDDSGSGGSVYYKNCSAARAAGAAPLHVGNPGYGSHLDRDGDGTACESR